jgi:hypothetical protein
MICCGAGQGFRWRCLLEVLRWVLRVVYQQQQEEVVQWVGACRQYKRYNI